MPVQTVIKTRRDTAANWTTTDPVLAAGEMGLETDTGLVKFGNGSSAWSTLAYMSTSRTSQIAKNDTGASVTKGQVVYISGANGANALFSLADADTELTSSKTVGLLAQNLATNGIGAIVTEGLLSGVDTLSATAGQSVWLSGTAGGFVFGAPPAKPAHSVYLGIVTRASATVGEILVKVQNGYELNELHDVNAGSPADNNLLAWDSATSMWINQTAAQVGVATAADLALKAPIASPTLTGTVVLPSTTSIGNVSDAELGYLDGVTSSIQTQLNAKATTASPTFTGTATAAALTVTGIANIKPVIENWNVTLDMTAGGTINVLDSAIIYYSMVLSNGTINFRGNSTTTLMSLMANGQSVTITVLIQNGGTGYYPTNIQVDGSAVTPKWLGGTAPTSGNTFATDVYTYTISKLGGSPAVFASVSKFA